MPGMNSGLNTNDPTVVAAFRLALIHQGILILLLFGTLGLAWLTAREWRRNTKAVDRSAAAAAAVAPEPTARKVLRIGFGLLWVLDGILQAQPGMAVGLPSQVMQPTAAASPAWVQHLVNWAGTSWSYHPIQAAAATVWIQVGIGLWLLVARSGRLSQLAGLAALGWGLIVWVFGEAFGGIFAPGLSWLTGAPGSAVCYCVAGALVALPLGWWHSRRAGRLLLTGFGVFLVGMAVLQAWPGRGFWQGDVRGQPGSLASMAQSMAEVSQPRVIASIVSDFAGLTRAHGFAVNLVAVVALAVIGAVFISARRWLVRAAVIGFAVFGAAVWLLVQDIGIFGGVGTDPNSMIPMVLLAVAGYLALTAPAAALVTAPAATAVAPAAEQVAEAASIGPAPIASAQGGWRRQLRPASWPGAFAGARLATVAGLASIGMILFGTIPLAAAQASTSASPILAEAIDGASAPLNSRAPGFTLTDQDGRTVSLASLHGKTILLTFLDPVCVTDCPLIAQEFREAGELLGRQSSRVELVAVNLNPLYANVSYLRAFDQEEHLADVPNWRYLTGTPAQLQVVWRNYGVTSQTLPAGAMLGHSDIAFVIGPTGLLQREMDFDPGPGTTATESSFATELAQAAQQVMG
ncbi:MAG TPA: SCO family protein [Streptosporangiaceae bacterium]|nr:SCO family protein [Streptosporangiaceae bacterium]